MPNCEKSATLTLLACTLLCVTACEPKDTFTDTRDGKTYKTVKIGEQVWFAENLNYDASGSKCFGNKSANCDKYGRLYNLETAKTACPNGWHLPSNAEWDVLYHFAVCKSGTSSHYKEAMAVKFLKAKSGWVDYKGKSGNGTDDFGFSALPSGYGYSEGGFTDVGYFGHWWSNSEYDNDSDFYYFRYMYYSEERALYGSYVGNDYFLSVRCLQNTAAPPKGIVK